MDVAAFCTFLARSTFPPGGFVSQGRRVLGDTYDALVRCGVLKPMPLNGSAPCERGGDDCPRLVVPREEGKFLAYCASLKPECRSEILPATALTRFELNIAGLLRVFADAAGIKGAPSSKPVAAMVYALGRTRGERGEVAVFLALRPAAPDFLAVALGLTAKEPGAAVVLLVPLREEVPVGLPAALEVRGVSLVYLDEALRSEGDEVRLETECIATAGKPVTAPPLQPARRTVPYCRLIDRSGGREVSREEYEASLKARASVAFIIDAVERPWRVYGRANDGALIEDEASDASRTALVALCSRPEEPLSPATIFERVQSASAALQAVKVARRLIEGPSPGKGRWRYIETKQKGEGLMWARFVPPREGFMCFVPL